MPSTLLMLRTDTRWTLLGVDVIANSSSSALASWLPSKPAWALRLKARSWGASTPMKMCIQADLDTTGALRHMNKNNSERPVCSTHPLAPISTSFLFVFDTEWVMSTCEHLGRDTVLQTGVKIHWSRRSASSCFNRAWRNTKSSAKQQLLLSPWVMQHQPWPSPSAWTKTRSYIGAETLSFDPSFPLFLPFFLSFSSCPSS